MNKRDIADIVFVVFGILFFIRFIQSLMSFAFYLGMTDEAAVHMDRLISLIFSVLHCAVLAGASYLLIVKKHLLLDRVFPDGEARGVNIPDGLLSIADYPFWIRLMGIWLFLSAGTEFFGLLITTMASNHEFTLVSFNGRNTVQQLIVALLGIIITAKADAVASLLRKKKNDEHVPADAP